MRLLFGLLDPLLVEVRFLHCHIGGSRGTEPFVVFVPPAGDIGTDQNNLVLRWISAGGHQAFHELAEGDRWEARAWGLQLLHQAKGHLVGQTILPQDLRAGSPFYHRAF